MTVALFPFALGLAGDVYVASAKLIGNAGWAAAAAMAIFLLLLALWYAYPRALRRHQTD